MVAPDTYVICDTQTGTKLSPVFPSANGWGLAMNLIAASKQSVFELAATENAGINYRDYCMRDDWSRTLVTVDGPTGAVRDARIITSFDLDRDNMRLTVTHEPFRLIFSKRFPYGATSYWTNEAAHQAGVFTATSLENRSLIATAITLGTTGLFTTYSLPCVLPPIVAGTHSVSIGNWLFTTVDQFMTDTQKSTGGPDVDFEPRWSTSNTLEYLVRVGTDAAPALTDVTYDFPMNVADPALTNVHKNGDGNKVVTGVFTNGAGTGNDTLVVGTGLGVASAGPALDMVQPAKKITDNSLVVGQSTATLALNRYATSEWSFDIKTDALDSTGRYLGMMRIGSICRLHFDGDLVEPDGYIDLRVIGLDGDMSRVMTPTVQPLVMA